MPTTSTPDEEEEPPNKSVARLPAVTPPLPPGLEWGGPPKDNSDPAVFVELEIPTPGAGPLTTKVIGPKEIAFLALMIVAILASVVLWTVSEIGGPIATGLIVVVGGATWKKL